MVLFVVVVLFFFFFYIHEGPFWFVALLSAITFENQGGRDIFPWEVVMKNIPNAIAMSRGKHAKNEPFRSTAKSFPPNKITSEAGGPTSGSYQSVPCHYS